MSNFKISRDIINYIHIENLKDKKEHLEIEVNYEDEYICLIKVRVTNNPHWRYFFNIKIYDGDMKNYENIIVFPSGYDEISIKRKTKIKLLKSENIKKTPDIIYYIIHDLNTTKFSHMKELLYHHGVNRDDKIKWVIYPNNKDEITKEIIDISLDDKNNLENVSRPFKHYLALKDIINNNYEYAVIMEDNIIDFHNNIPEILNKYIEQLPDDDWDIIFDCDYKKYLEGITIPGKYIYKKSNEITSQFTGSFRSLQFYIINYKSAKKLYENYILYTDTPDHWMNKLFRKLDMNIYWAERSNVIENIN